VAQAAFAVLSLVAKPNDRVAYRFLLGEGSPSWRCGQYRRLREACEQTTLHPFQFMEEVASHARNLAGVSQLVTKHTAIRSRLASLQGLSGAALIDAIFPEGEAWSTGVREAWDAVGHDQLDPRGVLDCLQAQLTHPDAPGGDFARVMSLHKSKGLTSRVVVVTSCVEGMIPVNDPTLPAAEQLAVEREQRRLFYVALTRATETLVVSSCRTVQRALAFNLGMRVASGYGSYAHTISSRFLGELGPHAPRARTGDAWRAAGYT